MRAVIVERPGVVRVDDVLEPEPGPDEVVLQVGACGICGTDIHIVDGEFPPAKYPVIPGHELAGEVVAVGADVNTFKVGDRVGVEPNLNCGACYYCQRGMGNICERLNGIGATHSGGFAERVAVPQRTLYPLPSGMSFAAAALIEPVSCVVHGFHRLQPQPGETYLIYGAGPMGLQNAHVARFFGASLVALIDINPTRLERARSEFGFEVVGGSLDELKQLAPRGFDNVIEATGVTKVAESAIDAVKRRGKLLLFGVCPPGEKASYDAFKIYNEEITILGSMAVLNSYGPAIDLLAAGAVDAKKMVTHTFDIDEFPQALDLARKGAGLKIQIARSPNLN
jgi:2-desacetyl-2-hydroxyethyl bacteriochlorophyllide A dehydrogenase